jgi:hypothetical protein
MMQAEDYTNITYKTLLNIITILGNLEKVEDRHQRQNGAAQGDSNSTGITSASKDRH